MGRKPQTIEELGQWLQDHANDGTINGEPIVSIPEEACKQGDIEFGGAFVTKDIYNKTLLRAAALSLNKTQVGVQAIQSFLENPTVDGEIDPGMYALEFPFYAPELIANAAVAKAEEAGLTKSDFITQGLLRFINDSEVNSQYETFVSQLMEKYNVKREYVEMKILGAWRLRSRKARYEMSVAAGEFVNRRKLPA